MSPSVSLQIFVGLPLIALVFSILEQCRPLARQRLFRQGWKADVAYYALGSVLGQFSTAGSLAAMLVLRHATGLDFGRLAASQPDWLQVMEIILISDFSGYLFHRLLHSSRWLWRFHRVHHSSRQMDWLAAARLHPVDKLLGDFVQLVPLLCLGFGDQPLVVYAGILGFQMFLNHANVRVDLGPLRWIVAGPDFHQWHHCENPAAYNRNFSPHLVIFDRLFGTAHIPPVRIRPWKYGVREKTPEGFWRQLAHPFHEMLRAGPVRLRLTKAFELQKSWDGLGAKLRMTRASCLLGAALLFALLRN